MNITHGLLNGQVLQRDRNNQGNARIRGTCRSNGQVELRVLKKGKVLRGHTWTPSGEAGSRRFDARLENLRAGGPYRIELRIHDGKNTPEEIAIDDIFVGDVWMLAGQSNMQGLGNMEDAPRPHPMVRAFYMRDEWGQANEPLHFLEEGVDIVHNGYGDGPNRPPRSKLSAMRRHLLKGVSPGLGFGRAMWKRTGVPQGLVACAHGGTSLAMWSPELCEKRGASLYGAMMKRYEKLGQPVAGVLWYQGESDTDTPQQAENYTANMKKLIEAVRRDTGQAQLPWVIVQLGRFASRDKKPWNHIQEQQRQLPNVVTFLDVVPAVDLELDDSIHIGGKAQQLLGVRLARVANHLVHQSPGVKPSITLKAVNVVPTPPWNAAHMVSVEVTFNNVAGKLQSPGRPVGFALIDADGNDTSQIYKTTLHGNKVLLHTGLTPAQLADLTLRYGHGQNPYCNITDKENMSLPAMTAPLPATVEP